MNSNFKRLYRQVLRQFRRELRDAKKLRLRWPALLCIIVIALPVTFLFDLHHRIELAMPVMGSVGVLGCLVRVKWTLRREAWFWLTIAGLSMIHLGVIWLVPWTSKRVAAPALAGAGYLDFCFMLLVLIVVERSFSGRQTRVRGGKRADVDVDHASGSQP